MTSNRTLRQANCSVRLGERVREPTGSYHPPTGGCFTALSRSFNTITSTGGGHGQREKSNSRHQDWEARLGGFRIGAERLMPGDDADWGPAVSIGSRSGPNEPIRGRGPSCPTEIPFGPRGFVPVRVRLCVGLVSGKFCGPSRIQARSSTHQFSIHAGALIHVSLAPCIPPALRSPPVLRCPCPVPVLGRSGPGADRSGCPCARGGPERYPHDP